MYLSAETLVQRLKQFGFQEEGSTKKVYRLSHPSLSHLLHVKKPLESKKFILAIPVQYQAKVEQALNIPVFGGNLTKSSNFKGYTPAGGSSNPALGFDFQNLKQFDAFLDLMFGLTLTDCSSSMRHQQNEELNQYTHLTTQQLFKLFETEDDERQQAEQSHDHYHFNQISEEPYIKDEHGQAIIQDDSHAVESYAMVKTRIGQDKFREALKNYWGGCALTGLAVMDLLIASHIKPWHLTKQNPDECLDVYNGLLLSPNIDKAFDQGLLSFNNDGSILLSSTLSEFEWMRLGLHHGLKLRKPLEPQHHVYLDWHRKELFQP